jgi:hypothetical protein
MGVCVCVCVCACVCDWVMLVAGAGATGCVPVLLRPVGGAEVSKLPHVNNRSASLIELAHIITEHRMMYMLLHITHRMNTLTLAVIS